MGNDLLNQNKTINKMAHDTSKCKLTHEMNTFWSNKKEEKKTPKRNDRKAVCVQEAEQRAKQPLWISSENKSKLYIYIYIYK